MEHSLWLRELNISQLSFAKTYVTDRIYYPIRNHARHHHGFIYTTEGTESYIFADQTLRTAPDTVLYIPKGEAYTIQLSDPRNTVITMEFELDHPESMRPFCIRAGKTPEIKSCFLEAERACNKNGPAWPVLCRSLFYKAVYLMIEQEERYLNSKGYQQIAPAVEHLRAHCFDRDFRIETLFAIADISPKYFETLFRREFGMTPREYVLKLKMDYAKELLKNEKYSVGATALEVGYGDVYHFSKIFKAKVGCSPAEYKKSDL